MRHGRVRPRPAAQSGRDFKATLEEAIHADLLLHVLDVGHPHAEQQFKSVHEVLDEVGVRVLSAPHAHAVAQARRRGPRPAPKNSLSTAWNLTSSSRAVLSARSRKLPMRRKWNASSCSIVPTVTPRDRCERNLTHSNASLGVALERVVATMRWNSSQVWFCVSQTSVVSVPRTARAFSRAASRQLRMLEPLLRVADHVVA